MQERRNIYSLKDIYETETNPQVANVIAKDLDISVETSQTGFTKKYAKWISEEAGADCFELRVAKNQNFDGYDAIVFGGWACAGRISKISWFKSNMDK